MNSRYTFYTTGFLLTEDIETKHNRKDIKLLAAKETTYNVVNAPSTSQI